uniref:Uncharacterized protein n=1 Tax=Panagrolaimus davidi TaxID=227884 RepID=A0A914Q424_9BILA
MPPSLNKDILTEIVEQLLKNGNQDSVIQFCISGKEPLKALIKVFALIKHVELYDDYYTFGLDNKKCCEFYIYDKNEPYFRSLMLFSGDSVTNLQMDFSKESSVKFYQPFLDKISEIKKLTILSIPSCCKQNDTIKFIRIFSSTIKEFSINPFLMNNLIRDSLTLEKLTILQNNDKFFFQFCPQTSAMIFENSALVKELHFNVDVGDVRDLFQSVSFTEYMITFSSLEHIKFYVTNNIILSFTHRYYSHITDDIYNLENAIKYSVNVPSKVTYFIQYPVVYRYIDFSDTPFMTDSLFKEYEYDDNVHDVYCLRQKLESAGMKPVDLEIHVAKST